MRLLILVEARPRRSRGRRASPVFLVSDIVPEKRSLKSSEIMKGISIGETGKRMVTQSEQRGTLLMWF